MTALLWTIAHYVSLGVNLIWWATGVAFIVLGLWAIIDCLRRPADHFVAADKRTKGFWLACNIGGLAVVAFMGFASMLGLIGAVVNAVYLTDVRPSLDYYKPVRVRSQIRPTGGSDWRR